MSMEINQVLAQMRVMSAQTKLEKPATETVPEASFGDLLKDAVNKVNETQHEAKSLSTRFEMGDTSVELPEVMVALQKSSVSFQAMNQVRNRLLSAYQEVMNMQV